MDELKKSIRAIREVTDCVSYIGIKSNMKLTFDDIEVIAERNYLQTKATPIIKAWNSLMKSGQIFDSSTWVLQVSP